MMIYANEEERYIKDASVNFVLISYFKFVLNFVSYFKRAGQITAIMVLQNIRTKQCSLLRNILSYSENLLSPVYVINFVCQF
jgi:hypothetical protein